MNFDKFTLKLQSAIEEAAGEAQREKHSEVTPAHIIKALTEQKDGVLRPLFEKLGVSPEQVIQAMDKILSSLPKLYGDAQVSFSRSAARILSSCDKIAADFKDEYISAEHFLIALLTDECQEKDRKQYIYHALSLYRIFIDVPMNVRNVTTATNIIRFGPAGRRGTDADCNVVNAGVRSCTLALAALSWLDIML